MNRIFKKTLIFVCLSVICCNFAFADFEDVGCGARPIGMGNAFTALADDLHAVYYNPAGLGMLSKVELSCEYGRLYIGFDDASNLGRGFLGYVQPMGTYGTAAGYYGTFGIGWQNFTLDDNYQENIFSFSYGRRFTDFLSGGASVKALQQWIAQDIYTVQDAVFNYGGKDSVEGASFDLGALYELRKKLFVALTVKDVNQPDMGFGEESKVPLGIKIGIAYHEYFYKAALDVGYRDKDLRIYAGGEKWFLHKVWGIRGGLSVGNRDFRNIALGASFSPSDLFRLDYAFVFPLSGISDTSGSHRVSLTLHFGPERLRKPVRIGEETVGELEDMIRTLEKDRQRIKQRLEEEKRKYSEQIEAERLKLKKQTESQERKIKEKVLELEKGKPRTHRVSKGENIRSIAVKYYGDEKYWIDIYNANKDKIKRGRVLPGQILTIP
jgi:hypothetical protein